MSDLSNKTAYLKGLAEGMKLAEKSDEGSIISKLIEVIGEMASEIDDTSAFCDGATAELDALEESVKDMSLCIDELYDMSGGSGAVQAQDIDDDDVLDSYADDDGLFEIHCPECGEDVIVDFDMLDEQNNIICPNCQHDIELEFDVDDEEEK